MALDILGHAAAWPPIQKFPLFLNPVQAGFPSPADDFIESRLDLNQYLVSHPVATFFVRATGDSMVNAGIFSGDILIVDTAIEARSGMVVIAVLNGEFTVKRLLKHPKRMLLVAENSAYPSIEIKEGMDCAIWGVVTYSLHAHVRHA